MNGLMEWAKAFKEKPKKVFVTHGNDEVTEIFAKRLHEELGYDTMAPFSGTIYDLTENTCVYEATGVKIEKVSASPKASKAAVPLKSFFLLAIGSWLLLRKMREFPIRTWNVFPEISSRCVTNGTDEKQAGKREFSDLPVFYSLSYWFKACFNAWES